jgi:hypothetical protein
MSLRITKAVDRFTFGVSLLLAIFALIGALKVWSGGLTLISLVSFVAVPVALAGLMELARRKLSVEGLISIHFSLAAALIGAYAIEIFLHFRQRATIPSLAPIIEAKYKVKFDLRTAPQVIADMRSQGLEAYPAYAAKFLKVPLTSKAGVEFMPISSIANVTTVHCNESGNYRIYKSDEFGFANPKGLWGKGADVAVIGDSFVHGSCVDKDMPTLLRTHYPRTINAGYGGLGPLAEYGILLEYLAPERPKLVLWYYFENDLNNLIIEMRNPVFRRYIETGEPVGLRALQPEIDKAVADFMTNKFAAKLAAQNANHESFVDILLMRSTRARLGLKAGGDIDPDRTEGIWSTALPDFERVMSAAKAKTESWGGKLVFIYLPSAKHFMAGESNSPELAMYKPVLEVVKKLGLPVLDIKPLMAGYKDPIDSFWYAPSTHYNEKGYAFVVEATRKYIDEEKLLP